MDRSVDVSWQVRHKHTHPSHLAVVKDANGRAVCLTEVSEWRSWGWVIVHWYTANQRPLMPGSRPKVKLNRRTGGLEVASMDKRRKTGHETENRLQEDDWDCLLHCQFETLISRFELKYYRHLAHKQWTWPVFLNTLDLDQRFTTVGQKQRVHHIHLDISVAALVQNVSQQQPEKKQYGTEIEHLEQLI